MLLINRRELIGGLSSLVRGPRHPVGDKRHTGGGQVVALRKTGSAALAPAHAIVEMIDHMRGARAGLVPVSVMMEGEYGIEDATFMDDARTLPGEGMATVSEAIAAVPVQVKQAKQWRAFKRSVAVTGEPQLIVRENESRAAIKIQDQAGTGTVQIGATEGAAMSDADSVTLSSTSDDPIYSDTIGEFWAYIAPGGTTDVVIQVQEDTY